MWRYRHLCCALVFVLTLCSCSSGIYHEVKRGQTLYRISRAYGVSQRQIAAANRISDPSKLQAGTRLYIPGADRVRHVSIATPARASNKKVSLRSKPAPSSPAKKIASSQSKSSRQVTRQSRSVPPKATKIKKLHWPLRGKIIRSFSSKAKAGGGKGIEIAVRDGSTVVAAEAGKVIYSGNGVNGYGYLIILQHENDFFTVYGFNQRNLVRQGDFVSQGEKIALSGTPPAGGQPRLHFEVRKGKQAVNPILYLP